MHLGRDRRIKARSEEGVREVGREGTVDIGSSREMRDER